PDLAAEIVRRGHRVENHTWSHPHSFAFFLPKALSREVRQAQEALAEIAAQAPRLFRAPAGIRNPCLDPVLTAAGLTLASWTRRGYDTVDRRADRVAGRLVSGLAAGDVLLLHDRPTVARTAGGPAAGPGGPCRGGSTASPAAASPRRRSRPGSKSPRVP